MEKGWVKILSGDRNEMEMKSAVLKGHDLTPVVINKQDSSYLFGAAELYVQQDEVIRAKRILNEQDA